MFRSYRTKMCKEMRRTDDDLHINAPHLYSKEEMEEWKNAKDFEDLEEALLESEKLLHKSRFALENIGKRFMNECV